jgi:Ca2+-binding RTX toxin-like protein
LIIMANESFWGELANNMPGATADGVKAFFTEFGKIQDDFVNGRITDLKVAQAGARAQTLALAMERSRASVVASLAAAGTAMTPDQLKFDAYWRRLTEDLKSAGRAWTDVDTVSAVRNFGANAARVFGGLALLCNISQVRDAVITGSGEEVAGALAGWAGGSVGAWVGAGAGAWFAGLLGLTPVGWGAIGVIGIGAGVFSLLGATGGGYAGNWLFRQYTDFQQQRSAEQRLQSMLSQVEAIYGLDSPTYLQIKTQLVDGATRIGRLDGTWMQGFANLSSTERADLTALLIGSTHGRTPDALRTDLRTLFDFDWGIERLPLRDALIDLLSTVSRDRTLPYEGGRMSISLSDGSISVEVPPQLVAESEVLRRALAQLVDDADSHRLLGITPDQTLVGRAGGTVAGTAVDDLIVGAGGDELLSGGGGTDALVGGAGADTLHGGEGSDVLLGGSGADVLDGGALGDYLYGGSGADVYRVSGAFGADWITDSDGQGTIEIDGEQVTGAGAKKVDVNTNAWSNGQWAFALVPNGGGGNDLIIQRDSSLNQIRVRNWVNGQLGITLGTELALPAVANTYTGDFAKATSGNQYLIADGRYVNGDPQADAQDLIAGGALADSISGLGGNDALSGRGGDDLIEGGAGDDVLLGGSGVDTLRGGTGNDFIFGSGDDGFDLPTNVNYTPPASQGTELARGFNWVVYDPPGVDGNGQGVLSFAGTGGTFPNGEQVGNLIDGGLGNDYVMAGSGADTVFGGADHDSILGLDASDVLFGEDGNDSIFGDGSQPIDGEYYGSYVPLQNHGNDVLAGGAGNDALIGQGGDDELQGGDNDDTLWGDDFNVADTPLSIQGNDSLDGGAGHDKLIGGGRDDVLIGGIGDDSLWGDDTLQASPAGHGEDYLDGGDGADRLVGGARGDALYGGVGSDSIWGDGGGNPVGVNGGFDPAYHGSDLIDGEEGDDYLQGEGGSDELIGGSGADTLSGDGAEFDLAGAFHGADTLDGGDDHDVLRGDGGDDLLYGGIGNDTLNGDDLANVLAEAFHGDDLLDGEAGNDVLFGSGGDDVLYGGEGADILGGDLSTANTTASFHGRDVLLGEAGDDILLGQGGDDMLEGGDGSDYMSGDAAESEVAAQFHGNDVLYGGEGNDTLVGTGGKDLLSGGSGDDVLAGDAGDLAVTHHGADTLDGGAGNDDLIGGAGQDELLGGDGADWMWGEDGHDTLEGGAGNDYLEGQGGADTYVFGRGRGNDIVFDQDATAGSVDRVRLDGLREQDVLFEREAGTYSLVIRIADSNETLTVANHFYTGGAMPSEHAVEAIDFADGTSLNLGQIGLAAARRIDGSAIDNFLIGTTEREYLRGYEGDDTLAGGGGNDLFDGGSGNDLLSGGTGRDRLSGGSGADRMDGASGDDWYAVDHAGDVVVEAVAGGYDRVESSVTYTLTANTEIEELVLTGSAAFDATGNAFNNSVYGNSADNVLSGAGGDDTLLGAEGNDTLVGGSGNDRYVIDVGIITVIDYERFDEEFGGDVVVELEGQGVDTVDLSQYTGIEFYLPDHVEVLDARYAPAGSNERIYLSGNAISNTVYGASSRSSWIGGYEGDDTLVGASGNDTFWGGTGSDSMWGGAGDDMYSVDVVTDVVDEGINGGIDTVQSDVTYTLTTNIENLSLYGIRNLDGTGNELDNVLTGSFGANRLIGNAGNDRLDGRGESDTMLGGIGDDVYVVDVSTDVVTENAAEGIDTVLSSVTFTLSGNVENISLTGTDTVDATGNALANVITGNSANNTLTGEAGNDTLDGGSGTDSMVGGSGDDTYYVERTADVVTETSGNGTDTVITTVTLTALAANVENLALGGVAAINGTANTLNNLLTGNGAANTLAGLAGDDTYVGGAGNDTLNDNSTSSNDVYRWGIGQGNDSITDAGGTGDRIEIGAGVTSGQVVLTRSGNNLQVSINGASDALSVVNWYASIANRIEEIRLADGTVINIGTAAPASVVVGGSGLALSAGSDEAAPALGARTEYSGGRQRALGVRNDGDRATAESSPPLHALPGFAHGNRTLHLLLQAMSQFGERDAGVDAPWRERRSDPMRVDLFTQ